jgi:hypothetical protein
VSSDVKTMTCCLERPPLGEIRIDKQKIVVPLYRATEGGWNLRIYVKYHDWNDLTYWLGSLPTQLIDYSHLKYSADPFRFIQWRQYSIAEDEFLMKYIEKVRRYPKRYVNLGPP